MLKMLFSSIVCATMLLGGNMQENSIQKYITTSTNSVVIIDNEYKKIDSINELNIVLDKMLTESRTMPAFGVSIHIDTITEIQNGVWLKLQYNGTQYVDDMPFDELLIKVEPSYRGFNIIRGNRGIYEGRCYYIDLVDNTMQPLYKWLKESCK